MTFIKKACRKHGIKRWPFRKVQAMRNRQERTMLRARTENSADGLAPVIIETIPLDSTSSENPFLASVVPTLVPRAQARAPLCAVSMSSGETITCKKELEIDNTCNTKPPRASGESSILGQCVESPPMKGQLRTWSPQGSQVSCASGDTFGAEELVLPRSSSMADCDRSLLRDQQLDQSFFEGILDEIEHSVEIQHPSLADDNGALALAGFDRIDALCSLSFMNGATPVAAI